MPRLLPLAAIAFSLGAAALVAASAFDGRPAPAQGIVVAPAGTTVAPTTTSTPAPTATRAATPSPSPTGDPWRYGGIEQAVQYATPIDNLRWRLDLLANVPPSGPRPAFADALRRLEIDALYGDALALARVRDPAAALKKVVVEGSPTGLSRFPANVLVTFWLVLPRESVTLEITSYRLLVDAGGALTTTRPELRGITDSAVERYPMAVFAQPPWTTDKSWLGAVIWMFQQREWAEHFWARAESEAGMPVVWKVSVRDDAEHHCGVLITHQDRWALWADPC